MIKEAQGKEQPKKFWSVAFIVGAVALGLLLSAKPWRVYAEQRAQASQYEREMRAAEQKRVELAREQATLNGPLGREQAAREAGLLKPGEQPVAKP